MKSINHLYEHIADYDNLLLAYWKASRGKQAKPDVTCFRNNLYGEIGRLHNDLLNKKAAVGDYHYFKVYDPKERLICAASFQERVLHHAIMNICEPYFEDYQIFDSYACRKGKGALKAIQRAGSYALRNSHYLKLDIARYFDTIDHGILMSLLKKRFRDKDLLSLFERIIGSYQTAPGKGIPIGNLTSQHFANYYLGLLDHHLKDDLGIKSYVRYMDDFIIFHTDRTYLKRLREHIKLFLDSTLRLRLNAKIYLNHTGNGIEFLGYRVFPNHILLSGKSKNRFARKFRQYEDAFKNGLWSERELSNRMEALIAFTRHCQAAGFRRNILERYGAVS